MQHFTYSQGIVYTLTLHNAVGVSTSPLTVNSVVQLVAGAKAVGFEITGATITTRSAVFTVTASFDGGTNFRAYSMLIENSANATANGLTRVATITQAATGTTICWMTPETLGGITHIKTTLVITDTGTPVGTFTVRGVIAY